MFFIKVVSISEDFLRNILWNQNVQILKTKTFDILLVIYLFTAMKKKPKLNIL